MYPGENGEQQQVPHAKAFTQDRHFIPRPSHSHPNLLKNDEMPQAPINHYTIPPIRNVHLSKFAERPNDTSSSSVSSLAKQPVRESYFVILTFLSSPYML
ncbi:hypothetical protein Ciccas_002087 [Cichlidogyrus casuarinus]|uniref:Uncharacterized protein n=1 Tax=Cichlidogyrus casuarinus TaxID=1844966 RepID=A0ABD2QI78_9PLAT